jgi:hypothetical protein
MSLSLAQRLAQAQLDAYNARDITAFAECYHPNVEVYDLGGDLRYQGRDTLVENYGPMFESRTGLHAELVGRLSAGDTVVDQERVVGLRDDGVVHALAIYRVADGLIRWVWFSVG